MYDETEDSPSVQGHGAARAMELAKMPKQRTKLDRLHDMKRGLEAKLAEVNKAIELLQGNPQLTEVIDALEKAGV